MTKNPHPVWSVLYAYSMNRKEAEDRFTVEFQRAIRSRKIEDEISNLVYAANISGVAKNGDDTVAVPVRLLLAIMLRPPLGKGRGNPGNRYWVHRIKRLALEVASDRYKELRREGRKKKPQDAAQVAADEVLKEFPAAKLTVKAVLKHLNVK